MNIDLMPNGAIKRVHVSQNDVGRTLTFELFNNSTSYTVPSGATVKIQGTKPSGFGFSETCTVSGNVATIDTTEAMTDEHGYINTELSISYNGNTIGTSNFVLAVEKNPHPSNTTDGTQITAQSLQVQINELAEIIESGGSGLTNDIKQALLDCFSHVAWIDEHGQDYYDALESALYPPIPATAISLNSNALSFATLNATQILTATLTPSDTTDTVSWSSSDTSIATVSSSGLVTSVAYGSCTITATAGSVSATCSVVVAQATVTSINAVYTQSGTVYDTDSLSDLTSDLVVTATWSDSTTSTVSSSDYTLSGTLTVGTSTITVSYGGQTTTFNVTVTEYVVPSEVLQYAGSSTSIDFTTFEDRPATNYWRFGAGTLQANKLQFTWDPEECDGFQIVIAQYDSSGNPYKLSKVSAYSSSPITDGANINVWSDPVNSYAYTAIGGGNIEVSLPTTGLVKVVTRRSSASGTSVTDNTTYGTWLANGGLTVTAIQE